MRTLSMRAGVLQRLNPAVPFRRLSVARVPQGADYFRLEVPTGVFAPRVWLSASFADAYAEHIREYRVAYGAAFDACLERWYCHPASALAEEATAVGGTCTPHPLVVSLPQGTREDHQAVSSYLLAAGARPWKSRGVWAVTSDISKASSLRKHYEPLFLASGAVAALHQGKHPRDAVMFTESEKKDTWTSQRAYDNVHPTFRLMNKNCATDGLPSALALGTANNTRGRLPLTAEEVCFQTQQQAIHMRCRANRIPLTHPVVSRAIEHMLESSGNRRATPQESLPDLDLPLASRFNKRALAPVHPSFAVQGDLHGGSPADESSLCMKLWFVFSSDPIAAEAQSTFGTSTPAVALWLLHRAASAVDKSTLAFDNTVSGSALDRKLSRVAKPKEKAPAPLPQRSSEKSTTPAKNRKAPATEEPATPAEEPATPATPAKKSRTSKAPATEEPATPAEEPATPATPAKKSRTSKAPATEEPATPAEEPATPATPAKKSRKAKEPSTAVKTPKAAVHKSTKVIRTFTLRTGELGFAWYLKPKIPAH
eukprot:TRINITY_DN1317_c0_g1_i1.p1 TRINITY_DN1317_c0_g1~~TRINITY_DN1317_c0_g1_i1.p1  ORF type:complete len:540 (-),score=57.80 TRINITY_DN1317_c0_g1_i1:222-1841(-)